MGIIFNMLPPKVRIIHIFNYLTCTVYRERDRMAWELALTWVIILNNDFVAPLTSCCVVAKKFNYIAYPALVVRTSKAANDFLT